MRIWPQWTHIIANSIIPTIFDKRVVMSSIGLSTVYYHTDQFIVDMTDVDGRRRCHTQTRTEVWWSYTLQRQISIHLRRSHCLQLRHVVNDNRRRSLWCHIIALLTGRLPLTQRLSPRHSFHSEWLHVEYQRKLNTHTATFHNAKHSLIIIIIIIIMRLITHVKSLTE